MNRECEKAAEMAARLVGGEHWSEDEKTHFLACEHCQKVVHAALAGKRKTQGPDPESDRSRPSVKRALERARKVFQREFGISLGQEPASPPEVKAS